MKYSGTFPDDSMASRDETVLSACANENEDATISQKSRERTLDIVARFIVDFSFGVQSVSVSVHGPI